MRFIPLITVLALAATQAAPRVGWRFTLERDSSRAYTPAEGDLGGPATRPIAITLWYPAGRGGSTTTLGDLARLGAYQSFGNPPSKAFEDAVGQARTDTSPAQLSTASRAFKDAAPAPGKYPLILFAHSTPIGQSLMAEDLAANGFVVAGLISRGATAGSYRLSVEDVRAMAADLEFARRHLESLPFVDASRVGMIGMSNGALGAIGAANQIGVRAIVSLDGTIGERAAGRVLPSLPDAASPASTPALLHLYTTPNDYLDFAYLRSRPGTCAAVHIPAVRHADFLSYGVLTPPGATNAGRLHAAEKFDAILRLTREWLKSALTTSASPQPSLREADRNLGLQAAACRELP